jgi:hypothetical protein
LIHQLIFHNDRIVPIEEARLSPSQAGLLNGWGLFTTMRIFQGEAFAYERHWRRLQKDAGRIGSLSHSILPWSGGNWVSFWRPIRWSKARRESI